MCFLQCKERHINICPELEKTGKCAKGKNCPYPHKSVLLAQQHHHRTSQNSKKAFNKPINNKKKITTELINLPLREENKKRYYDDNNCCLDEATIATKKIKILEKINIMKHTHTSSTEMTNSLSILPDSIVDNDNTHQQSEDEHSQPCHQNVQYKRRPIGPLPAYIPIE